MVTHNNGRYIAEAVASVLGQTLRDLELVVVDNGTTDGSVDAIERNIADPRLHIVRLGCNRGIATGLNAGLDAARGEWRGLLDADDIALSHRLELQLAAARADPSLDVVTGDALYIDADGRLTGDRFRVFHVPEEIAAYTQFNSPINNPTLLARRAVHDAVRYRSEAQLASDYDWISRVVERFKVGSVGVPVVHYRRHPGSSTVACSTFQLASASAVRLATARRRAGRPENFDELQEEAARWETGEDAAGALTHFARRAASEGFALLAAYHAALAVRWRPSPLNQLRFVRALLRAVADDPGSWREAAAGVLKGPFWIMLKRGGFPPFPRY